MIMFGLSEVPVETHIKIRFNRIRYFKISQTVVVFDDITHPTITKLKTQTAGPGRDQKSARGEVASLTSQYMEISRHENVFVRYPLDESPTQDLFSPLSLKHTLTIAEDNSFIY
jgi:hypothetical protein